MRKINYKYWYEGQPVARLLNGPDYVLFQDKVAYQGFTVKGAMEYVRASRERRRLKAAALASKTIRDRFTEPAAMHRREKKFYEAGIARLEQLYMKKTGKEYPAPCPRPNTGPRALDVMYLTTRYGAIKLAIDAYDEAKRIRRMKRDADKEHKARLARIARKEAKKA